MILFFLRRYNDIDHTVPIIYRMAKDGFRDVEILCTNANINLDADFRLAFLSNRLGIYPRYATHFFWPTRFQDQIRAFTTSGLYYRRSIINRSASSVLFLKRATITIAAVFHVEPREPGHDSTVNVDLPLSNALEGLSERKEHRFEVEFVPEPPFSQGSIF